MSPEESMAQRLSELAEQSAQRISQLTADFAQAADQLTTALVDESAKVNGALSRLNDTVGALREKNRDDHNRLATGMATIAVHMPEQSRLIQRQVEISLDALRREMLHVRGTMNELQKRPPSMTVVSDVQQVIQVESSGPVRDDDWSLVHIDLSKFSPSLKKKIALPNRVVWGLLGLVSGGGLMSLVHWLRSL